MIQSNASQRRPWPVVDDPFHPAVMSYANMIRQGGMLIVQSYYGGIDTDANPDYVEACRRQLQRNWLTLLEVYRFAK